MTAEEGWRRAKMARRYLAPGLSLAAAAMAAVVAIRPEWRLSEELAEVLLPGALLLLSYASFLTARLADSKSQAEEANRAKTLFLASVSHELRTPLNAIIGLGGMLRTTRLDAAQREMTDTIAEAGRSLLTLITSILDFARYEAGSGPPEKAAPFDLHALLAGSCALMGVQLRGRPLRLGLHVSLDTPRHVVAVARRVEEILLNLVGNALKFTEAGSVLVEAQSTLLESGAARVRITVSDTGIGIAPEAQDRIFESFTQAEPGIIDQYGGTGLGLTIAKRLVRFEGGRMGLTSAPGEGSAFWFEIDVPVASDEPSRALDAPVVLISEDECLVRRMRQAGADCVACGPTEAGSVLRRTEAAARRTPIVLLDEQSAGGDAAAFLDALGADGAVSAPASVLLTRGEEGAPPSRALRLRFRAIAPRDAADSVILAANRPCMRSARRVGARLRTGRATGGASARHTRRGGQQDEPARDRTGARDGRL